MKAAETKTTTAAQHLQAKGEAQQPFFQKEGGDCVLSNQTQPFFSPSGSASDDTQPFFTKSTPRPIIQAKLTIGQPGDKYEQEADSMADQVVQKLADTSGQSTVGSEQFTQNNQSQISKYPVSSIQHPISKIQRKPIFESEAEPNIQTKRETSNPKPKTQNLIQRKCAECEQEEKLQQKEELGGEEEPLQMKPIFESNAEPPEDNSIQRKCSVCGKEETIQKKENGEASTTHNLESTLNSSKGSGSHLPDATRTSMEGAFGADFSNVRVHTNSTAVQMNKDLGAQAFTHGSDVYFNAGKYNPGSGDGQKLLAHELTHTVQQGGIKKVQKSEEEESLKTPKDIADKIYEYFHGSSWTEEEEKALSLLKNYSGDKVMLENIRKSYLVDHKVNIEKEFKEYASTKQFKEALSILLPVIPLFDRLKLYDYSITENEGAILNEIKNAKTKELEDLRNNDSFKYIKQWLEGRLSYDEYYEAWKILDIKTPDKLYEQVIWRIKNAESASGDNEEAVFMAVLELDIPKRKSLWQNNQNIFNFLSDSEKSSVEKLSNAASQADSLDIAMQVATEGGGTYDKMVSQIIEKTKEAARREEEINQQIAIANQTLKDCKGICTPEQDIGALTEELKQLGNVRSQLLTPKFVNGKIDQNTFLGRLQDDVDSKEFKAFSTEIAVTPFDRAKAIILNAPGLIDDEKAIWDAFDSIKDPEIRKKLNDDYEVQTALKDAFYDEELEQLKAYITGDTYSIALHKLELALDKFDTDEVEILRIIVEMSKTDREKILLEKPKIYNELLSPMYMAPAEIPFIEEAFQTGKIPKEKALDWALIGSNSTEMMTLVADKFSMMERFQFRLGYYFSIGGTVSEELASSDIQKEAVTFYNSINNKLTKDELGTDEFQKNLDRFLGKPTPMESLSIEGRKMAASILERRVLSQGEIRESSPLSSWFTDQFSESGEISDQSEARFRQYYEQFKKGEITEDQLIQLVVLEEDFREKYQAFVAATDVVSDTASTVAAIIAAIAVTVVTGGAGAPAAGAGLAEIIGSISAKTVVTAALVAGTTKVVTKEILGGEHYDPLSAEGAKDFLIASIDGAMVAVSAPIAHALTQQFLPLVGLRGAALTAELTAGAIRTSEMSVQMLGRQFVVGGLEAAIDGVLSGVVGELVLTTLDAKTWEEGVWNALMAYGRAVLRGAAMGGVGGFITGGLLEQLSFVIGKQKAIKLFDKLKNTGLSPEELNKFTLDQLTSINKLDDIIQKGDDKAIDEGLEDLRKKLSLQDFEKIKKVLLGDLELPSQSQIEKYLEEIRLFRIQQNLRPGESKGTVAFAEIGGEKHWGSNLELNYNVLSDAERDFWWNKAYTRSGNTIPAYSKGFLRHAEASALFTAFKKKGKLPSVVNLYVDRTTCDYACAKGLEYLIPEFGISELRIFYKNEKNLIPARIIRAK